MKKLVSLSCLVWLSVSSLASAFLGNVAPRQAQRVRCWSATPIQTSSPSNTTITTRKTAQHPKESTSHDQQQPPLTSVLLQVSYDGSRFSGWSAGNTNPNGTRVITHAPRSSRRRRNRHLYSADAHGIRSVQGVLTLALGKIYGNIDLDRIVVEGASRTDKGVHATGMVAHVYGLVADYNDNTTTTANASTTTTAAVISGKRLPHPRNATDPSAFLPLPMPPAKLAFALNRMLPPDVRILQYASLPTTTTTTTTTTASSTTVFHASQSATSKTYVYRLAHGPRPDPTQGRTTWYMGANPRLTGGWNATAVDQLAQLLTAQAYNYAALAGAPRGADDKRKRATQDLTCRLYQVQVEADTTTPASWHVTAADFCQSYTITVTGDRFLYKMMRFLVGTIVAVATHKMTVAQVQDMLLVTGVRPPNVMMECAPPHGLVLQRVHYYKNDTRLEWHTANS